MRIHRSTGTNPPKERICPSGVCGLGLSIYPINRLFHPILALQPLVLSQGVSSCFVEFLLVQELLASFTPCGSGCVSGLC